MFGVVNLQLKHICGSGFQLTDNFRYYTGYKIGKYQDKNQRQDLIFGVINLQLKHTHGSGFQLTSNFQYYTGQDRHIPGLQYTQTY